MRINLKVVALLFAFSQAPAQVSAPAIPERAVDAKQVPARTMLQIRLRQTVASFGSKPGTPVSAILISPVEVDGHIVLPLNSELHGTLARVRSVGLGFGSETAIIDLKFETLTVPGGQPQPINAQVSVLNNSRESVDLQGNIHGIRATATPSKIISGFAISAASFDPMSQLFAGTAALSAFRIPESEIILPVGAELALTLHAGLTVTGTFPGPPPALQSAQQSELAEAIRPMPFRTTTTSPVLSSDLITLLYLGSQDAITRAFAAAGWSPSDALSTESRYGVMRSVIEDQGYKEGPVSTLLLGGKLPVATYSKSLDTFFKRDHLRIYSQPDSFDGTPIFTSTATHDSGIAISSKDKKLIHLIDENIDEERGKVVNDLLLTGCVDGVDYIERPWVPLDATNATGDKLITDGRIAVVRMNACDSPQRADDPGSASPVVKTKAPAAERVGRDFVLYFRDDFFRGNIVYQGYAGTRMLINMRKKPEGEDALKPKVLNIAGEEYEVVSRPSVSMPKGGPKDPGSLKPSFYLPGVERTYKTRLNFSVSGGYSRFANSTFSTQNLIYTLAAPPPIGGTFTEANVQQLHTGWSISVYSTLDSWKYVSNEFGYSYNVAPLTITGVTSDPTIGNTFLYFDGQDRQFTYNALFHFRPNGKRFRPYVLAGSDFQLLRLTDSKPSKNSLLRFTIKDVGIIIDAYNFGSKPPLEGGGIFQFGLQYGAGFKYQVTPHFFVRSDFRETLSAQPNYWKKSLPHLETILGPGPLSVVPGSYTSGGPLRQQLFSAGFGVSF